MGENKTGQSIKETDLNGKKVKETTMGSRVFLKEFFNAKNRLVMTESYSVDFITMSNYIIQKTYHYSGNTKYVRKIKTYDGIKDKSPMVEYQYKKENLLDDLIRRFQLNL